MIYYESNNELQKYIGDFSAVLLIRRTLKLPCRFSSHFIHERLEGSALPASHLNVVQVTQQWRLLHAEVVWYQSVETIGQVQNQSLGGVIGYSLVRRRTEMKTV